MVPGLRRATSGMVGLIRKRRDGFSEDERVVFGQPYVRFIDTGGGATIALPHEIDPESILRTTPARKSPNFPGQKNITGYVFSGIGGNLLWRESNVEAICVLEAEYSHRFVGLVSQPFDYRYNDATRSWHVPDFFGLDMNGTYSTFDVKEQSAYSAEVRSAMSRFADSMEEIGIGHAMWHEPSLVRRHNLRRLSRVRLPGIVHESTVQAADQLWIVGDTYGDLEIKMNAAGCPSMFVRYAIEFLIWHRRFEVDLEQRLCLETLLSPTDGSDD